MSYKIAVIVGSLRKDSLNKKVAKALTTLAPKSLQFEFIDIGCLPLYNQDLDATPPDEWKKFREQVKNCQGVLFVTPEYNRSVPGVLKNAIDVGSRPYGQSVWSGKPGAVISASPSALGGFGANHHLRQSMVFLDIPMLQQPESYIGHAGDLFNEQGEITNSSTRDFLQKFIDTYASWVEKLAK